MAERTLVARILKDLRARGIWAEKTHGGPYQQKGLPDIIGCLPVSTNLGSLGVFIGIEVKDGKMRGKDVDEEPIQTYVLNLIKKSAGIAVVIRTQEEWDQCLATFDGLQQTS